HSPHGAFRHIGFYHDVRILRYFRIAVSQNLLNDFDLNFRFVQASCEAASEAMPAVPESFVEKYPHVASNQVGEIKRAPFALPREDELLGAIRNHLLILVKDRAERRDYRDPIRTRLGLRGRYMRPPNAFRDV